MHIPVEWAPVIAKAWLDEAFKKTLERDPITAFSQFGLTYHGPIPFTVPPRPQNLDISNMQDEANQSSDRGDCSEDSNT